MPTKSTATLSLPKTTMVRGYEIKRLPLGGYLQAMNSLNTLPDDLLAACFPGDDLGTVFSKLKNLDVATLQSLIGRAVVATPEHLLRTVSMLTGIAQDALLEDPAIGLDGLVEILQAWVEVNRLGDFPQAVRRLMASARAAGFLTPNSGSNGSSPSA